MVIIIAGVAYFQLGKAPVLPYIGYNRTVSPSPKASPTKLVSKATTTPLSSVNSGVLPTSSYTDLVKQYSDRRIQFDEKCQTTPAITTFKNNTSILLDNRSSWSRAVSVGGVKYQLSGYGYKVVTLSSSSLPKELSLDCENLYNVGKILLQAKIY